MKPYNHLRVEKKWQKEWQKKGLYTVKNQEKGKKNEFVLVEFPYPSGNLHVGHWYAFAVPDMYARLRRMQGSNVLYPIGFDAFGLPAENAAIKRGINPRTWTYKNMAHMRKQIASMGASFDWNREVVTCDPGYYKWTQWLFLQLHKKGLVYKKDTPANWCPSCKTVLANEQVVGGECERCGTKVEQRMMPQWNIAITKYADRLVDDLDALDWPEAIKDSQRNWIGRSEGAEIDFGLHGVDTAKRVVVLHGKGGSPEGAFIPWLVQQLKTRGYTVEAPQLPNPTEPNDSEQADFVEKNCTLDANTVIVGHSFGGIVAMRLLERGHSVHRVTLVGTPFSGTFLDKKKRPTIAAACKHGFNFEKIKQHAKAFLVLSDSADHVVPEGDGEAWAQNLGGQYTKVVAQKSHFNGTMEPDVLMATVPTLRVFTTRPDTLFGATCLIVAPEHKWVQLALTHKGLLKNEAEVREYQKKANQKTELERQENKDKTGVELSGVKAIHPATGAHIPVFIADYVLANYGTGAIMAVPAHDERDYEFAKKYGVPTPQVVTRLVTQTSGQDAVREGLDFVPRKAVMCIVKHWEKDEYLCQNWKGFNIRSFVSGGIEEGEDAVTAGKREILEESGYKNARFIRQVGGVATVEFYHNIKKENRRVEFTYLYFELENDEQGNIEAEELAKHDHVWKKPEEVIQYLTIKEKENFWKEFTTGVRQTNTEAGYLINSGQFNGMHSELAKKEITAAYGVPKKTYRLRDWLVSRQRYWGVPIPMVYCESCGHQPVPEKQLPVELPRITDYLPTGDGKSPLAKASKWVRTTCPQCKKPAQRETDTFDTFICSSWYYLRYSDPKNKKLFADPKLLKQWLPVDLYSGGAEHTTMHVLYSRFWHKALYDLKLTYESEPYTRRMNRGLILGPDGQKMSKSKGNVIDPDDVVKKLGADTVRLYLAFIGPFNEPGSYPWSPEGIVGVRRFLERVWRLQEKIAPKVHEDMEYEMHRAIKKVTSDMAELKFNTAIAALMTLLNAAEKHSLTSAMYDDLLRMIAPLAPHISEELWHDRGHKKSVHLEKWPKWSEKKLLRTKVTLAIQVNGKLRGTLEVSADETSAAIEQKAVESVQKWLEGKQPRKVIVVQGKIVNIVV